MPPSCNCLAMSFSVIIFLNPHFVLAKKTYLFRKIKPYCPNPPNLRHFVLSLTLKHLDQLPLCLISPP